MLLKEEALGQSRPNQALNSHPAAIIKLQGENKRQVNHYNK